MRQTIMGWVKITVTSNVPAINNGYNVSSVTDDGTGIVTITWIAAAPSADYPVGVDSDANKTSATTHFTTLSDHSAGSIQIRFYNWSAAAASDPAWYSAVAVRTY